MESKNLREALTKKVQSLLESYQLSGDEYYIQQIDAYQRALKEIKEDSVAMDAL